MYFEGGIALGLLLRMPRREARIPHHVSLALSVDPVRYLHLDLRRLARPGLPEGVRQEHLYQGVSRGVLPVSVPGRAVVQERRQRSTFYGPPTANQLRRYLNQIPEDFEMCFKVWKEITIPTYAKQARYGARAGQPNPRFKVVEGTHNLIYFAPRFAFRFAPRSEGKQSLTDALSFEIQALALVI